MSAYSDLISGTSGLVSYWRLAETGATAVDEEAVQNGTYTNSPTRGVAGLILGDANLAAQFTNTQYVSVAHNAAYNFTSTFTVECWFKPSAIAGATVAETLADKGSAFALNQYDSNGRISLIAGGAPNIISPASSVAIGSTYHICAVYDGPNLTKRIYINGTDVVNGACTAAPSTNTNAILLSAAASGVLDEAAIYNVALSPAQVTSHYNLGSSISTSTILVKLSGLWVEKPIKARVGGVWFPGADPSGSPSNTDAPAITGTATTGNTVTVSNGTWTNTPSSYARQWKRNGTNIGGATNTTYVLQVADEGQSVKATVTATNASGSSSADSNTITPWAATGAFPDATNTGHLNAPGYPGSLTPFSGTITSGTTYNYRSFDGADVGVLATPVNGVTFNGCRFWSNWVDGWNVKVAGYNITFNYCTFEPTNAPANRVNYFNGYQYGILQDTQFSGGSMTVDHCDLRAFGNGMQISYSTQARPVVVQNSWFHDARTDNGGVDHTDGILSNNANLSYVVINHNTISSLGNTQGIALQSEPGDAGYNQITITNNYLSGFGYTVAIGENETGDTNITFTDNVFGTDFEPIFGWLYDDDTWTTGNTHTWRRNTLNVRSYPTETAWNYLPTSDDGKYVHPNGTVSATDYAS